MTVPSAHELFRMEPFDLKATLNPEASGNYACPPPPCGLTPEPPEGRRSERPAS